MIGLVSRRALNALVRLASGNETTVLPGGRVHMAAVWQHETGCGPIQNSYFDRLPLPVSAMTSALDAKPARAAARARSRSPVACWYRSAAWGLA